MIKGNKYRHCQTLDTDLYVISVRWSDLEETIVRAAIVNRNTEEVYEIGTYTIKDEDMRNWRKI
jgi:hypothetical protein